MKNKVSFVLFFITFSIHQFDAHHWMEREMNVRVPDFLEPERYEIDVTTDVTSEKPNYSGEVTVTLKCVTTTNRIIINENFLQMDSYEVSPKDKTEDSVSIQHKHSSMKGNQIELILNRHLQKDNSYEVKMKYRKTSFLHKLVGYQFEPYEDPKLHPNIQCVATTKQIIMNENFLNIERIQVWSVDKKELTSKPGIGKGYAESGHQITLKLDDALEKNSRYEVKIKYNKSSFLRQLFGYIFRPYEEPILHPDIHFLAYTQMKEIEARRVFPCLDQIGMKSTFSIRLRHPAGTKSISNAKKIADGVPIDEPRGWVMDKFADVESMSTFSVAFVVADYHSIGPAKISDDVPHIEIKLWAEKEDLLENLGIVMDVSSQIYTFFFNYFKTPHKLGKLDLIAMPNIYEVAQNSYGLIILRQNDFLEAFDLSNRNVSQKYNTVSKLCNAMSEQWIGHSVTMKAWNETWLHFGINAFLQKLCVRSLGLFDQWRTLNERLLVESFFTLLRNEERGDYNPVVSSEKDSFFTAYSNHPTTYKKVHHVIRMLSFILESEKDVFRKSLENYVKKFEGGNTDVDKTWEIFNKTVYEEDRGLLPEDITVKMIMDSWLTQKGHPVINVSLDESTDGIIVSQEPFNFPVVGKSEMNEAQKPCWIIPLTYATKTKGDSQKVKVQKWLKCDGEPVRIGNVDANDWILFNLKLHVPCRVNYEYLIWLSIRKLIQNPEEFSRIDPLTRVHLISDMFALAEIEKLSYQYLFTVLNYILDQEENYDCWKVAISELNRIRLRWNGTELNSYFKQYVRNMLRPIINKKVLKGTILTFEKYLKSERKNDVLEMLMILAACMFEALECGQLTYKLLAEWSNKKFGENSKLIPIDLRESVFCLAMKNADMRERDYLFRLYQPENLLNNIILNALGCSGKKEILEKYLQWGMEFTKNKMTTDISLKVFEALSLNPVAHPIILDYLEKHYQELEHFLDNERTDITTEHFLVKVIDATRKEGPYKKLIALLPTNGRANKDAAIMVDESKSKTEWIINWLGKKEEEMIKYFILK